MKKDIIKFIEKESLMDILYRICTGECLGKCHGRKMILVYKYIYYSDVRNHGFDKMMEKGSYYLSTKYKFCSECGRVLLMPFEYFSPYITDTKQKIREAWLELDEDIKKRLIGE